MLTLIGFLLLVSPCGHDACDALPVSERIYSSFDQCERMRKQSIAPPARRSVLRRRLQH